MPKSGTWHLSHHNGLPVAIFVGETNAIVRVIAPRSGHRFVAALGVGGHEVVAPVATIEEAVRHLRSTGSTVELSAAARSHLLGESKPVPDALAFPSGYDLEARKTATLLFVAALTLLPFVTAAAALIKWGLR